MKPTLLILIVSLAWTIACSVKEPPLSKPQSARAVVKAIETTLELIAKARKAIDAAKHVKSFTRANKDIKTDIENLDKSVLRDDFFEDFVSSEDPKNARKELSSLAAELEGIKEAIAKLDELGVKFDSADLNNETFDDAYLKFLLEKDTMLDRLARIELEINKVDKTIGNLENWLTTRFANTTTFTFEKSFLDWFGSLKKSKGNAYKILNRLSDIEAAHLDGTALKDAVGRVMAIKQFKGIYELKFHDKLRVYFDYSSDNRVVLIHGSTTPAEQDSAFQSRSVLENYVKKRATSS